MRPEPVNWSMFLRRLEASNREPVRPEGACNPRPLTEAQILGRVTPVSDLYLCVRRKEELDSEPVQPEAALVPSPSPHTRARMWQSSAWPAGSQVRHLSTIYGWGCALATSSSPTSLRTSCATRESIPRYWPIPDMCALPAWWRTRSGSTLLFLESARERLS